MWIYISNTISFLLNTFLFETCFQHAYNMLLKKPMEKITLFK